MKLKANTYFDKLRILFAGALKNKPMLIFMFIITILFILLSMYLFNQFKKNNLKKGHVLNKEYLDNDKDQDNPSKDNINIMYFYTEWCPYCKKAKPEWDKFSQYINNFNKTNKKYSVTLKSIDCDKDTKMANKYNIKGYPTIKLIKDNKVNEYDARPDKDNLVQFLESYI